MTTGDEKAQKRLQWLLDAPLFIDEALTARLFDAVVRPSYEVQSREVGEVSETARRRLLGGEAEAGYDLGLSFLTGALKLRGQISEALFLILQEHAARLSAENALSALKENFEVFDEEIFEEEEIGSAVFGASLCTWPEMNVETPGVVICSKYGNSMRLARRRES